jgi:hypothetical protein
MQITGFSQILSRVTDMLMQSGSAHRLATEVLIDLVEQQIETAIADFGITFAAAERADVIALLQALQIVLEQGDPQEIYLIEQGLQSAIGKFRDQVNQRLREEEALWHDIWSLGYD